MIIILHGVIFGLLAGVLALANNAAKAAKINFFISLIFCGTICIVSLLLTYQLTYLKGASYIYVGFSIINLFSHKTTLKFVKSLL